MPNFDFDFELQLKNMEVKTRENFQMGYSSAYPKWRELGEKWGSEGVVTNREFREVLEDRTARYAVDVFKFLRSLPYDVSVKIISYQLGKSASSIGANYHEANRAESRDDFVHKISISLKETNESLYWFKVLSGLYEGNEEIERLSNETKELRNVLQSILRSAKAKPTPSPTHS